VHDDSRVICSRSASIEHVQGLCNQDVMVLLDLIMSMTSNVHDIVIITQRNSNKTNQ